jgi:hypothetical protein
LTESNALAAVVSVILTLGAFVGVLSGSRLQHQAIDSFEVSRGLVDGREIYLFRFVGQGVFQTGWDSLLERWTPERGL